MLLDARSIIRKDSNSIAMLFVKIQNSRKTYTSNLLDRIIVLVEELYNLKSAL
jgi:hypothetical protein